MKPIDADADQCASIRLELDAFFDDELTAQRRDAVKAHVADCDGCRRQLEALERLEAELDPLRERMQWKAEQLAVSLESEGGVLAARQPESAGGASRRPVLEAGLRWCLVAAAALLMFAWIGAPDPTPPPRTVPVAQLVAATGPVEFQSEDGAWKLLVAQHSTQPIALRPGQRLRTASAACELQTQCDSSVRINNESEIVIRESNQVELVRGQLWVRSAEDCEFTVSLGEERLPSFPNAPRSFTCPSKSEIQWAAENEKIVCVSTCPNPVRVESEQWVCTVRPGESFELNEWPPTTSVASMPETKAWQIPLLHLRGAAVQEELNALLEGVLENIGMTKASYFHESQIRALGPRGADPLLAYVLSPASRRRPEIRLRAARIGCDMADEHLVPSLQRLATDPTDGVQQCAVEALQRLGAGS